MYKKKKSNYSSSPELVYLKLPEMSILIHTDNTYVSVEDKKKGPNSLEDIEETE